MDFCGKKNLLNFGVDPIQCGRMLAIFNFGNGELTEHKFIFHPHSSDGAYSPYMPCRDECCTDCLEFTVVY